LSLVDLRGLQVLAHLLAVDEEEVLLADVLLKEAGRREDKIRKTRGLSSLRTLSRYVLA